MRYFVLRSITWVLMHLVYFAVGGIRFEGRDNVPLRGGVLITPNHISDADPPTVALALPRPCWFMAHEELFQISGLGTLMRWLHTFPVKRNSADRSALRRAEELLKQGEAVMIFPEGKLSADGKLQRLHPGALLIARMTGVPIVPTIVIGTNLVIPYGQLYPRPAKQRTIVRFGPAVTLEELTGDKKGSEALDHGAARLHELMLALQEGRPYPLQ